MTLQPGFYPLASGSKGNCILFVTDQCKLLIDAGISGRATKQHLNELGMDPEDLDGILITHEHGDHIQGLKILAYKLGIPVLANSGTAQGILNQFNRSPQFKIFSTGETFFFKGLEIHPFSIQHDTRDPVGFTLRWGDLKMGFCTDLGFVTTLVRTHLKQCDYLYLEANHEPHMVHACARPMTYKQRVLGKTGHLSNAGCAQLLIDVWHSGLRHVHLAHLSSECNTPEAALSKVRELLQEAQVPLPPLSIAHQDQRSTPVLFDSALSLTP